MAEYGLLGVRFDSTTETLLRVEVPYADGVGNSWPESLGAGVDDVRWGLPRAFTQSILDATAAYANGRFPPGILRIVEAAHGLVGSNTRLFKAIATCALEIMLDAQQRGDAEMASWLRKRLV